MNKRQQKKQFKKKYGINPMQVKKYIERTPSIVDRLKAIMQNLVEYISEFVKNLPEHVRNMSEEEFNSLMDNPDLSASNKILLLKYREDPVAEKLSEIIEGRKEDRREIVD